MSAAPACGGQNQGQNAPSNSIDKQYSNSRGGAETVGSDVENGQDVQEENQEACCLGGGTFIQSRRPMGEECAVHGDCVDTEVGEDGESQGHQHQVLRQGQAPQVMAMVSVSTMRSGKTGLHKKMNQLRRIWAIFIIQFSNSADF